jgi:glycosyltransferase involved in cell wall biosynthesis
MPESFTPQLLSVVTAVAPQRTAFLGAAGNSLRSQVLPAGWRWEWVIQSDGPGDAAGAEVAKLDLEPDRVRMEISTSAGGAATARNVALGRARGEFVINLDADDEYVEDSLAALIAPLSADASLGWVAGRTTYLHQDGSSAPYPDRLGPGRIECGTLGDDSLTHDRPARHPSAVMVRTKLWSSFGGWMALTGSEDTGTLLAISEYWPGAIVEVPVLRYRKWDAQTTSQPGWRDDKPVHYRTIAQRLASIRSLRGDAELHRR